MIASELSRIRLYVDLHYDDFPHQVGGVYTTKSLFFNESKIFCGALYFFLEINFTPCYFIFTNHIS